MMPKISVVMPVYNSTRFLPAAIESVLSQSFKDFELIICDDASTEDVAGVVKKYNDSRIYYCRNPWNLGLIGNTNMCLKLAHGEYIKFLDADDALWPGCLEEMVKALDKHPSAALVTGMRILINEAGDNIGEAWHGPFLIRNLVLGREVLNSCLRYGNVVGPPSSVMVRRLPAVRMNPDYQHLCDLELWIRLLIFKNLVFLPWEVCQYRIHGNQSSHTPTISKPFAEDYARLLKEYLPMSTLTFFQRQAAKTRVVAMVYDTWRKRRMYSFWKMLCETGKQIWRMITL